MNKHQYYNTSTTIPVLQYQYSYFDSFLQSHLILISRLFRPNSKVKGIQTCHLPPLRHTTSYGVALYLYTWYCNPSGILLQEDLTHLQLQLLLSLDVRLNICQMFLGSETEKKHKMIKALKHSVFISHGNRTGCSRYCSTPTLLLWASVLEDTHPCLSSVSGNNNTNHLIFVISNKSITVCVWSWS